MHEYCNLFFAISTLADILIIAALFVFFVKVYRNKIIITENNGEIRVHDKAILALEKKVEELTK